MLKWISLGLLILSGTSSADSQQKRSIAIYFDNPALESAALSREKAATLPFQEFPVVRVIKSSRPERQSILELLRGPTRAEVDSGYSTNLERLTLSRFDLSKGKAALWLKGRLLLKGTLSGPRLRKQIEQTLMQFRSVRTVILYVNGKKDFDSLK